LHRKWIKCERKSTAKRLLEAGSLPVDDISAEVSYEDASFFRRLFKRLTGLTPSQYRRMFQPITVASQPRNREA
jgi:AraC-like DNA-binding protein